MEYYKMEYLLEKFAIGFVILLVVGIVVFPVSFFLISHIGTTNNGEHVGYITAVEQEGWLWKTWRAYVKTDTQSSQEDQYCVVDDSLIPLLKEKAKSRELISVEYSAPFIVWNWECARESSIIRSVN